MLSAVEEVLPVDVAICAAAVADWRPDTEDGQKMKKRADTPAPDLHLVENPDILLTLAQHHTLRPRVVVGFAAETETVVEHAKAKLARKGCDLIVANDVSTLTGIMGGDRNQVHLVSAKGVEDWEEMGKADVAARLVGIVAEGLKAPHKCG
jgi:phosphopantothenoylcysteine decarboxylase/phosphopantothenate--cysteine ligase